MIQPRHLEALFTEPLPAVSGYNPDLSKKDRAFPQMRL